MPFSSLCHSVLADCRRLYLRDYELMVHIGVHEFEKNRPQRLVVNVDLYVPLSLSTPRHDRLAEVVDYDLIRQAIACRTAEGHVNLQESLCDQIADALMAHPAVRAVRVSTMKPDAYRNCAGVGVEVFRVRPPERLTA